MQRHLTYLFLFALLTLSASVNAQKVIEYEAGMGTRDANDPSIWILYNQVRATHDGMVLYADSAWLNTERNDFTAFGNIRIELTDTTTIFGDRLYYDGASRMLDIWDDTVVLIDGNTILRTALLSYDRNKTLASYSQWGHTISDGRTLISNEGYYNSHTKALDIYQDVVLTDTNMRLITDTLHYNTATSIARFVSPTYIYSDSTTIYSEKGFYHTDSSYAVSTKASRIATQSKILTCDSLNYWEATQRGEAYGHVTIVDTANNVICNGRYGETDQTSLTSFVTESAMVRHIDNGDTLFMHADTLWVYNDSANHLQAIQASHHAKFFRKDVQGLCDSAYYHVTDSLMRLFYEPVLWYDNYQLSADSIDVKLDTNGIRISYLEGHSAVNQRVDRDNFNQLCGKRAIVHFFEGEPTYADILGNAQMVYHITETDSLGNESMVGVNAGVGADIRIYFLERKPHRVVTYGNPDMNTYPLDQVPPEMRRLADFKWLPQRRPQTPLDIFKW